MARRLRIRTSARPGVSVPKRSCATRRLLSLVLFTAIFAAVAVLLVAYSRGWHLTTSALAAGQMGNQAPATVLQAAAQGVDPPGTIDGAKNPELIPDDVAYRLVLLAIAEPQNATDAQQARFRAKIASAKLGEEDILALLQVLGTFQGQLDALTAQANAITAVNPRPYPGSVDYQKLLTLSQQRQPVFEQAMSALPARLSSSGLAALQTYVQNAKRGMKYVPDDIVMPSN